MHDALPPMPDPLDRPFGADVSGHRIDFQPTGPDRRAALLTLINGANTTLKLQFYIFEPDAIGTAVRDALIRAAERGVAVTLILDSFGSADTPPGFFHGLTLIGGKLRWFGTRWTPRYLIRNHQKLVIADDHALMAGGFNIADAYFALPDDAQSWQDLGFTLTGPAVADAALWFDQLDRWISARRPRFSALRRIIRTWQPKTDRVRWLIGGPTKRLSSWARSLRDDVRRAHSLSLVMGYFSPDAGLMRRIAGVARRGGAVQMILPARSDNGATVGASRLLYGYLLKRGVAIAEFERNRLHSKIIAVDNVVYVGSANLDLRSLYVNVELMLRIEDAGLAAQVHAHVQAYLPHATAYTAASHAQRMTWLARARWSLAWVVVALIDYTVTRRLNFGLTAPDTIEVGTPAED